MGFMHRIFFLFPPSLYVRGAQGYETDYAQTTDKAGHTALFCILNSQDPEYSLMYNVVIIPWGCDTGGRAGPLLVT